MRSMLRPLGILLLFCAPLFAAAQDTSKEKAAMQKMYVDFLNEEGYRPEIDSDGDIQFKAEGRTYFINVVEDDPTYFRVVLANIWPIESEDERVQCLVAVDYSNAKAKVTKSYLVKDNIWVGIETFIPEAEDFKKIFKRCMSALNNGVTHFVSKMKEQQGN